MDLPRVRGTLRTSRRGHAVLAVRCPECGAVRRHDEGPPADPEVAARLARGFVEAWMPCRGDLPGNFYRIVLPPGAEAAPPRRAVGGPPGGGRDPGRPTGSGGGRRRRDAVPPTG